VHLSIRALTKRFGTVTALDRVDLDIRDGEFVCLLGPSGCGKTTLLRIVAGLDDASDGRVDLDGTDLTAVPARRRGFGIVFQSYSLFPNLTVAENVGYGLKLRKVARATIEERVKSLLALVELPQIAGRFPHELSGGQQQRVALARALAVEPKLLLLDEPLSALDAKVRLQLRDEIRALQQRIGVPTLMVTHDQEEALAVADRVVLMRAGRIEQEDAPERIYLHPKTRFVAEFVGHMNFLGPADRDRLGAPLLVEGDRVPTEGCTAGIRPEHVALEPAGAEGPNRFQGRVRSSHFLGATTRTVVDAGGVEIIADRAGGAVEPVGKPVAVHLPVERVTELRP
jgi:iron(III) transport system ATP-binding protein